MRENAALDLAKLAERLAEKLFRKVIEVRHGDLRSWPETI
jgi:hypothetical protein